MTPKEIINKNSFIKYLKFIGVKDYNKYIKIIDFYQKNSIHNIYKISSYIFIQIENKKINNLFNYFVSSLSSNIKKLNDYQLNKISSNSSFVPDWFNKNIECTPASDEEIKELENLLKTDD